MGRHVKGMEESHMNISEVDVSAVIDRKIEAWVYFMFTAKQRAVITWIVVRDDLYVLIFMDSGEGWAVCANIYSYEDNLGFQTAQFCQLHEPMPSYLTCLYLRSLEQEMFFFFINTWPSKSFMQCHGDAAFWT